MGKIIVKGKRHLKQLIKREMEKNGNGCDLNHMDLSNVKDLSYLFENLKFNGSISGWNVGCVEDMRYMFLDSSFNGDLSE